MTREATGDSFPAAWRWMKRYEDTDPERDLYVVHAEVRGQGSLEGVQFAHAFVLYLPRGVEPSDENILYQGEVVDPANGKTIRMPAAFYFTLAGIFDIGNFHIYDALKAMSLAGRTGHYGPWDLETSSGL